MSFDKPPISVLGVGNILLQDEGFGVHVINQLEKEYSFSNSVQLLDGGTMGMELLHYLGDVEYLLLVDAISGGEKAGTIYEFRHEDVTSYFSERISVHEVGIQDILRIRFMQETPFKDVVVIGVEPESLDIGLDLTPVVESTLPNVKKRIIDQLIQWGVEVVPKDES